MLMLESCNRVSIFLPSSSKTSTVIKQSHCVSILFHIVEASLLCVSLENLTPVILYIMRFFPPAIWFLQLMWSVSLGGTSAKVGNKLLWHIWQELGNTVHKSVFLSLQVN